MTTKPAPLSSQAAEVLSLHRGNGDLLATAKRNGKVELWQVPDLKLVRTFSVGPSLQPAPRSPDDAPAEPQAVSVTFAHNVPRLAANNSEGNIFVWDVNTGKEIVRYVSELSSAHGNSSVYAPRANSLFFTLDDLWLLTIDQPTNGIRLLGAKRHKETGNVLTVPKHGEMEALNASATDGSVAFAYRVGLSLAKTPQRLNVHHVIHFKGALNSGEAQAYLAVPSDNRHVRRFFHGRTTRHQPIFLGNELAQMCRKLHRSKFWI